MQSKTVMLLTLFIISCIEASDDPVRFRAAQPEGQSNEKGIPKRLLGQYVNLNDSAGMEITSRGIVIFKFKNFATLIDSADRKELKGDTSYFVIEHQSRIDVLVRGDSAFEKWTFYDTIFDASRGDILRKYKGRYFLNRKVAEDNWRVKTLTGIKNGVTLGTVSAKDDIAKLREITGSKVDSINNFRLTRKELRKFLKENGFDDKETYLRLK